MTGCKFLYIAKNQVFHVPQPKDQVFKDVKEVANQKVLKVTLYYETEKRKPKNLFLIEYDYIQLDSEGGYNPTNCEQTKRKREETIVYAFMSDDATKTKKPIRLPTLPAIPMPDEKQALYNYLKKKHPQLHKLAPLIMEEAIRESERIYRERMSIAKKVSG